MADERTREYPYQELARRLRRTIDEGELSINDRLPSIRELARQHHVTPATAARAVRELIEEGYVNTVPGLGIFVTSPDQPPRGTSGEELSMLIGQVQAVVTDLAGRVSALEATLETSDGPPGPPLDRTTP